MLNYIVLYCLCFVFVMSLYCLCIVFLLSLYCLCIVLVLCLYCVCIVLSPPPRGGRVVVTNGGKLESFSFLPLMMHLHCLQVPLMMHCYNGCYIQFLCDIALALPSSSAPPAPCRKVNRAMQYNALVHSVNFTLHMDNSTVLSQV